MKSAQIKPIKVGIFADGLGRKGKGTAIVLRRLIEHLWKAQNLNIHLVYLEGRCDHDLCSIVPSIKVRFFKLRKFSSLLSYAHFFFSSKETFNIVHFPRPQLHPLFWLMKVLQRTRKIVVVFHGAPESHSIPIFETWQTRFNRWFIVFFGRHFIDAGIVLSESAREPVARYYKIPLHRIVVIHTGVDRAFSQIQQHVVTDADKEYLKKNYSIPYPYILTVGRMDPHKNIHRLIEGYAKARSKKDVFPALVIVGGKHEPVYTELVWSTIKKLGIKDYVYFTPFIKDSDLPLVYRCADTFLFVSLSEGFGMPLVEAMASGCPTLASNISAMPEIAGGAAYLADPYNINDIADGIYKMLFDAQLRETLIHKGIERARDFSWERCARETAELYTRLHTDIKL